MVAVCPVCREVVHISAGFILRHGSTVHLSFKECAGSGTPYCSSVTDSCCG